MSWLILVQGFVLEHNKGWIFRRINSVLGAIKCDVKNLDKRDLGINPYQYLRLEKPAALLHISGGEMTRDDEKRWVRESLLFWSSGHSVSTPGSNSFGGQCECHKLFQSPQSYASSMHLCNHGSDIPYCLWQIQSVFLTKQQHWNFSRHARMPLDTWEIGFSFCLGAKASAPRGEKIVTVCHLLSQQSSHKKQK